MKNRCNMISFELTAIDLILVIAVIVLLILYLTKFSAKTLEPKSFRQPRAKGAKQERPVLRPQNDYTECPRGFGNIKKLGEDNTVSERCLSCYKTMECYIENEKRLAFKLTVIRQKIQDVFKSKASIHNNFSDY